MGEAEEEERGREARPPPWSRVRTRPQAVRGAGRRDPGRGARGEAGPGLRARTEGRGWPGSGGRGGEGPAMCRLAGDRALDCGV